MASIVACEPVRQTYAQLPNQELQVQYFKVYEYGMWRVHALEPDVEAEKFLPIGAISISEAEAHLLSQAPMSEEFQEHLERGKAALGGRGASRYPTGDVKEAIGHICVNSAHLEVALRTVVWQAAGVTAEVGMALTGGKLAVSDLIETLQTLLEVRHPQLVEPMKTIGKRIQRLNDSRGKYVHGIWHPGKDGKIFVGKTFLKRTHAKSESVEVTLATLFALAEGYMQVESVLMEKILIPMIPGGAS
jgi:hypothetical protein